MLPKYLSARCAAAYTTYVHGATYATVHAADLAERLTLGESYDAAYAAACNTARLAGRVAAEAGEREWYRARLAEIA